MGILTYTGTLVVTTCWCGIPHAIPADLFELAKRDHHKGIYCPLGHSWVFSGETEAQRLKRELKWSEEQQTRLRAELDQVSASRRALKGQVTKLRGHVVKGECPFCGEHVYQLARHVARKHRDESTEVNDIARAAIATAQEER